MYTIMQTLTAGAFGVAGRRPKNAEDRLFELLTDNFQVVNNRLETLSKDLSYNTKKTDKGFERTNARLDKVEAKIFPETKVSDLPKPWRDPVIIKWALIIIALLVAGWFGIDVSGVLEK